jgi:hypothetical protein
MPALPEAAPPMPAAEKIRLTPALATKLLEANSANRPLSDAHVNRIAAQIRAGKWRFNGDTIKIGADGSVLDGQHRLWAVIEADKAVDTFLVTGIDRDSFATIDTVRRMRSGADVLALSGSERHRRCAATALAWLVRFERGVAKNYRDPAMRVENADVEDAFARHPGIVDSIARTTPLRNVCNPGLVGVIHYMVHSRRPDLAERMIATMTDPAPVGIDDPFFRLRAVYIEHRRDKGFDSVWNLAVAIKAANTAARGETMKHLVWRGKGARAEEFPELEL